MSKRHIRRALFLDRDGVLIKDVGFPHLPEHLVFCEGAIEGLQRAQTLGFELVIVTNQSGLSRGIFNLQQYKDFESLIEKTLLNKGICILKTYFCPHHINGRVKEWSIDCDCRKPLPGMLHTAERELSINLSESFMVGDRVSDLVAAKDAKLKGFFFISPNKEIDIKTNTSRAIFADKGFLGVFSNLNEVCIRVEGLNATIP